MESFPPITWTESGQTPALGRSTGAHVDSKATLLLGTLLVRDRRAQVVVDGVANSLGPREWKLFLRTGALGALFAFGDISGKFKDTYRKGCI